MLIPEGKYTAVATRVAGEDGEPIVRFAYAGEKKTKQVLVYYRLLEGEHAGQVLPWFGYFTEASWQRTIESLKYSGFKGNDLFAIEDQDLSQKVQVVVEHNENPKTGDVHARISWVNRMGSGAIKLNDPMARDDLRKFAALMKSRVSQVPDAEGEPASTGSESGSNGVGGYPGNAQNDGPPPADYDDIPF